MPAALFYDIQSHRRHYERYIDPMKDLFWLCRKWEWTVMKQDRERNEFYQIAFYWFAKVIITLRINALLVYNDFGSGGHLYFVLRQINYVHHCSNINKLNSPFFKKKNLVSVAEVCVCFSTHCRFGRSKKRERLVHVFANYIFSFVSV